MEKERENLLGPLKEKELLELVERQEKVIALFMEECTYMSHTNYKPHVIKELIKERKKQERADFCSVVYMDGLEQEDLQTYIVNEIHNGALKGMWYDQELDKWA